MKVNGKYIRGYCLPDYGKASKTYNFSKTNGTINPTSTTTKATTKVKEKPISMVSARVPKVQFGDENDAVKMMQILLTSLGYDCKGNDGSFGNNTLTALKAYQNKINISATGVCGKDTWPYLLQGKIN